MDPNQLLEDIRADIAVYWNTTTPEETRNVFAETVIEHFENLDKWLRTGGFLPDDWDGQ